MTTLANAPEEAALDQAAQIRDRLRTELHKTIIGQDPIIELLLISLLTRSHCLITGAPGLGKTLLVKSLAKTLSLSFQRIQFTPDLMPSDIFGTEVIEEDPTTGRRSFKFVPGPVFANIVLADEINRTPPKTQAALLEAMGEGQVTAAGQTHTLEAPFFVLATQNPIEMEGTYPLPEAQLDRFLFNVVIDYLDEGDEVAMVSQTTQPPAEPPQPVLSREEILALQDLVRQVPAPSNVVEYAVRLTRASRPQIPSAPDLIRSKVQWGAGSRASQALILGGKARALLDGRYNVSIEDVAALAGPVLRHRILPNFHAEAEGLSADRIIEHLIESTPA